MRSNELLPETLNEDSTCGSDMVIPMWLAKTIAWFGIALIGFAVIDMAATSFFNTNLTGKSWSSIAEFAGGFVIKHFGEALEDE